METRYPDAKRKAESGEDEAGQDAKRLCQPYEAFVPFSTDSPEFCDLAAWENQGQGWNAPGYANRDKNESFGLLDFDSYEHLNDFSLPESFQYIEEGTTPNLVGPDHFGSSTPVHCENQAEQLPAKHGPGSCSPTDYMECSSSDIDKEAETVLFTDERNSRAIDVMGPKENFPNKYADINTESAAYNNSSSASGQGSDREFGYDACFGVIIATPVCSTGAKKSTSTPVTMKRSGGIMKLYSEESSKYVGLLKLPGLCKLLDSFDVKLKIFLISSKLDSITKGAKQKKNKGNDVWIYSTRILVYGLMSDKDAVGNLLSEADLHLQHPYTMEDDMSVEYSNPHYLVRPGGQMPRVEDLCLDPYRKEEEQPAMLSETAKSHLLRIIDSADGMGASADMTPSSRLRSDLMDHQRIALAMMTEKERGIIDDPKFPPLWVKTSDYKIAPEYRHIITGTRNSCPTPLNGGILAEDMGLGKTLSMLALICSSLDTSNSQATITTDHRAKTTLIVAPKSTISGWEQQITSFDIVLTTYETLRSDFQSKGQLYSAPWFRLVLDEAHHIRNRSSQVFNAACGVRALYRWCLTGTPIQNSLHDYGALLSFLNVHPFCEKSQFNYWIVSSIDEPKHNNMDRLRSLVNATCLRRTKQTANINIVLPSRDERIEHITLSRHDKELYNFFQMKIQRITSGASENQKSLHFDKSKDNILALITILRRVCNHGEDLLPEWAKKLWRDQSNNAADLGAIQCHKEICKNCGEDMDTTELLDSCSPGTPRRNYLCDPCMQIEDINDSESPQIPVEALVATHPGIHYHPSAKVEALLKNLLIEQKVEIGSTQSKSVVFTSWTKMLDLIELAIKTKGFGYERLDGQTSLKSRGERIKRFSEDSKCTVMLATIGSTGEGVDFTAANHIHLLEPHWNPMAEAQAVDRVYRIGQVRPVMINRYIVPESIETYIQWVQEDKLRLINQSVNDTDSEFGNRSQILQNFLTFMNKNRPVKIEGI